MLAGDLEVEGVLARVGGADCVPAGELVGAGELVIEIEGATEGLTAAVGVAVRAAEYEAVGESVAEELGVPLEEEALEGVDACEGVTEGVGELLGVPWM